ncbi:hypothetical protein [Herbaspirillum huttiense]|uniref:Uncharacterized protein n=2 Tax=Herbaspirillum huttiense TaxID=863372 RepID=A0AAJ2HBC4_9BURK|nr:MULTISPECIES: hypothetical protein [Herbaspirillum]MDR9837477.1 hypothetical protein [Herbaspirillum huttiense]
MRISFKMMCFWMIFFLGVLSARAAVVLPEERLAKIRKTYFLRSDGLPQYAFVYEDGAKCCETPPQKPVFLLNLLVYGPLELLFSEEINALLSKKFVLEIDNDSLIRSGKTHYVVMTIASPEQQSDAYLRCSSGEPEKKAYLLKLTRSKVDIIHRNMLGCDTGYSMVMDGKPLGYEVNHVGEPVEFLRVRDGKVIRQIMPVE